MPRFWRPLEVEGKVIRRIRDRLKLTQTQLAEKVGVTKRTVIRWELGGAKFDRYAHRGPYALLTPLAKKARVRWPKPDR
jgi:transcriptional regulator with XRE-family HTH domain